jgi:hypothetical protein
MSTNEKKVYSAIAAVTAKLAKEGISKDRKNDQQGYKFRGIDDVYNALAPFLAEAKLCILPCVKSRECIERTTAKGNAIFYVTVCVDFAFVAAEDSSEHHVTTYGEAMDTADKATNKAMSAAYKYACMQAFCIPTEGDNDADKTTHEVRPNHAAYPSDGAFEGLELAERQKAKATANSIVDLWSEGKELAAYEAYYDAGFSQDVMLGIWELLRPHSAMRNKLKAMHRAPKAVKEAA